MTRGVNDTAVPQPWLRRLHLRYGQRFYDIAYASPMVRATAFNYGYAPVSETVLADPAVLDQALQMELYRQVLGAAPGPVGPEDTIVEVACGRGAGLAFLARLTSATVIGLDRSPTGVRFARRRFKIDARQATAPALGLPDACADLVICVEALHNFFSQEAIDAMARLLRPGGGLVIADCPLAPYAEQVARTGAACAAAGLVVTSTRDIAAPVLAACRRDSARRRTATWWLPGPIRRTLDETFAVEGTSKFRSLESGARGYYLLGARKRTRIAP